ncbi:hypothetical protein [Martelella mediterranea]|uniref:Uncharacterized protein n=1 Tax=Martelella mediterranea DSM 17316 TaxID=1122214 RepID=A0A1U9Z8Q2_9HYPH|nr:hypothetical protein [Martelella mediterranea]AQZ54068.1 hypothetical protein Mame_04776 [Martelella mediterranea DSM 17316]
MNSRAGRFTQLVTGWLLTSTVIILPGTTGAARADDECGQATGAIVTCDAGTYSDGVHYQSDTSLALYFINPDTVIDGDVSLAVTGAGQDAGVEMPGIKALSGDISVSSFAGDASAKLNEILTPTDSVRQINVSSTQASASISLNPTALLSVNLSHYNLNARSDSSAGGSAKIEIDNSDGTNTFSLVAKGNNAITSETTGNGDAIIVFDNGTAPMPYGRILVDEFDDTAILASATGSGNAIISVQDLFLLSGGVDPDQNYLLAQTGENNLLGDATINVNGNTFFDGPGNLKADSAHGDASIVLSANPGLFIQINAPLSLVALAPEGTASVGQTGGLGPVQLNSFYQTDAVILAKGKQAAVTLADLELDATTATGSVTTELIGVKAESATPGLSTVGLAGEISVGNLNYENVKAVQYNGTGAISAARIKAMGTTASGIWVDVDTKAADPNVTFSENTSLVVDGRYPSGIVLAMVPDSAAALDLENGSILVSTKKYPSDTPLTPAAIVTMKNSDAAGGDYAVKIDVGAQMAIGEIKHYLEEQSILYSVLNKVDAAGARITLSNTGQVFGHAMMGGGASDFTFSGGSFTGNIYGDYDEINGQSSDTQNQGSDDFTWTDGVLTGDFYGQGGNDTATLVNIGDALFGKQYIKFDGGDDIDTFVQSDGSLSVSDIIAGPADVLVVMNFEIGSISSGGRTTLSGAGFALNGYAHQPDEAFFNDRYGDLIVREGSAIVISPDDAGAFELAANVHIDDADSSLAVSGASHVNLAGNLHNRGLLSLANGKTGETLTIGSSETAAACDCEGSRIALDINLSAGEADTVIFAGEVTGKVALELADIGGIASGAGLTLVRAADGVRLAPEAFSLADGRQPVSEDRVFELRHVVDDNGERIDLVVAGSRP